MPIIVEDKRGREYDLEEKIIEILRDKGPSSRDDINYYLHTMELKPPQSLITKALYRLEETEKIKFEKHVYYLTDQSDAFGKMRRG